MTTIDADARLLETPADVERLGRAIARRLRRGDAVCLSGPLGAGKTTLARALIRTLTTPDEEAPSPTFTLVQTYAGRDFALAHFDLYRLRGPEDVVELGLDEALDDGAAIIEWPERLGLDAPADRLDVALAFTEFGGGQGRLVRLVGHGAWSGREPGF